MVQRQIPIKNQFRANSNEIRKSGDEISHKWYIDNVLFDVPAANVLRPDHEALGETVRNTMDTTEIDQEKATVCCRANMGGFGGAQTKEEELEMHIDECSKKLEDLQKFKVRGCHWDRLARVNEGLALLEEKKEVHSAVLPWLIRERQNVTDAKVWCVRAAC